DVDAWDRPVRITVVRSGDPLTLEQTFAYDANGRLEKTEEKKDGGWIATIYAYDIMGRSKSMTRDGLATVGSATTRTDWNIP
ncbi:hypothetical protein, partial [Escherichia coli]|uniref:hypothetical protein n=1 Tax=Escherichia coli TaxID=562 RepID=UPI0028DD4E05